MKKAFIGVLTLLSVFLSSQSTYAITVPEFPTCSAPSGELIANYDDGIHGIVGEASEFRGKDKVYKVNDAQVLQCFCPKDEGQGIQTLWWKSEHLNENDRSILENQGWIYIPTGRVWGLEDTPYVARNTRFDCKSSSAGGSGGSTGTGGGILGINSFANTGSQQTFALVGLGVLSVLFITIVKKAQ